jgi:hypothetical protein
MLFFKHLLFVVAVAFSLGRTCAHPEDIGKKFLAPVCTQIADALSSKDIVQEPCTHFPIQTLHLLFFAKPTVVDMLQYRQDISHWASSSSQSAERSVRPRTAADVASIVSRFDLRSTTYLKLEPRSFVLFLPQKLLSLYVFFLLPHNAYILSY